MKKAAIVAIVALSVALAACGRPQYLGDTDAQKTYYPTYGLFNEASNKSSKVCYELSAGNVIWSIILVETVIFPVYFIGWSIYNPVRLKKGLDDQCTPDG